MRFLTLALSRRAWGSLPLALFALLTILITTAQGTMDAQQAGGMEALAARKFGGLVNRQATNLQVRTLIRIWEWMRIRIWEEK